MASVNLEKTLKYVKIQERFWSENLTKYIIYIIEYFYMFFSTLKGIIQAQSKTNHWITS